MVEILKIHSTSILRITSPSHQLHHPCNIYIYMYVRLYVPGQVSPHRCDWVPPLEFFGILWSLFSCDFKAFLNIIRSNFDNFDHKLCSISGFERTSEFDWTLNWIGQLFVNSLKLRVMIVWTSVAKCYLALSCNPVGLSIGLEECAACWLERSDAGIAMSNLW